MNGERSEALTAGGSNYVQYALSMSCIISHVPISPIFALDGWRTGREDGDDSAIGVRYCLSKCIKGRGCGGGKGNCV